MKCFFCRGDLDYPGPRTPDDEELTVTTPTDSLPRASLGFFPTPLHDLPRLSAALGGPRLLVKRDDLSGLGLGGNKVRKLEYLLGEAQAEGCDTLVTGGAAQSNHCRQTAAAAARAGLECHLALGGESPRTAQGNLLLDQLLGAQLHWCGDHRRGEDLPELARELKARGRRPYVIPYGGSDAVGAVGFVRAAEELHEQLRVAGIRPTHVVLASSSGGSHAGLLVGAQWLGEDYELLGVEIDKDEGLPLSKRVAELARRTAARLGLDLGPPEDEVHLWSDYGGAGYGVVGDLERQAIRRCAAEEGLLLDPVYTGRAMGGLIDRIERGDLSGDDVIVFWHTGGQAALFSYAEDLFPSPRR